MPPHIIYRLRPLLDCIYGYWPHALESLSDCIVMPTLKREEERRSHIRRHTKVRLHDAISCICARASHNSASSVAN